MWNIQRTSGTGYQSDRPRWITECAENVDHSGIGDLTLTFTTGTQAVLLGVHDLNAVHFDYTVGGPITDPTFLQAGKC